jgi:hypothetical protein
VDTGRKSGMSSVPTKECRSRPGRSPGGTAAIEDSVDDCFDYTVVSNLLEICASANGDQVD